MAKELALIGCGNMGTAMLKGIVGSGLVAAQDVTVADVSEASQQRLAGLTARELVTTARPWLAPRTSSSL